MLGPGMIKVVASVGKGMIIIAKGHTARIIAVATSVGIVTISIAIATGMVLALRTLSPGVRRISSIQSTSFPRLSG
jgi:hypothetical protein